MKSKIGPMMDRRVRELILISLLEAFCGALAWAHDQDYLLRFLLLLRLVLGLKRGRDEAR